MEKILEFVLNHWELALLLGGLITALVVTESRRGGVGVSSTQLTTLINREDAVVLDVRDAKDFRLGHITGAVNIPFASIETRLGELSHHKDKPIVIVCKMGQHSSTVGKTLRGDGFGDVRRLTGGIGSWLADGLPLVKK
ncbi:MAG: rhodanese-like domain-containing protein [Pseudomonadales bacterium]|nr:rhodanese-like domain-containing protein [Pseudomonadales bacterium]